MGKILFITESPPVCMSNGADLRVLNLVRALSKWHDCFLASFSSSVSDLNKVHDLQLFKKTLFLPRSNSKASITRHFRLSDEHYNQKRNSKHFSNIMELLLIFIAEAEIEAAVAANVWLAEYLNQMAGTIKIVDDYDCRTLTEQREYDYKKSKTNISTKIKCRVNICRARYQEQRLLKRYDYVTTISPVDQQELATLNNVDLNSIILIPNGVSEEFFTAPFESKNINNGFPKPEIPCIAFWGNMDFAPNYSAMEYFIKKIYKPFLSQYDFKVVIAGSGASTSLQQLVAEHDNIALLGFVEDLVQFIDRADVVINPMQIGSGLKNKVLEAFSRKKAVVSTTLGVESLTVNDGKHCLVRDDPIEFANTLLSLLQDYKLRETIGTAARELVEKKYRWNTIAEHWHHTIM
jgi:glycosyltransferase involved in cell wall biosynthesis